MNKCGKLLILLCYHVLPLSSVRLVKAVLVSTDEFLKNSRMNRPLLPRLRTNGPSCRAGAMRNECALQRFMRSKGPSMPTQVIDQTYGCVSGCVF